MSELRRKTAEARVLVAAQRAGERGQGLVEYALVLTFVAVALVGTTMAFGSTLSAQYAVITSAIPSL